jgi:hypothetical protein
VFYRQQRQHQIRNLQKVRGLRTKPAQTQPRPQQQQQLQRQQQQRQKVDLVQTILLLLPLLLLLVVVVVVLLLSGPPCPRRCSCCRHSHVTQIAAADSASTNGSS